MENGTESQDDKANQVKEKEPVGITKPQNKQTLLTENNESDSDIPDSNQDVDKDKKVEDNETNQVEGGKDDDKVDNERKTGSESLARIRPAYDALEDNNFENDTRVSAKSKSDKNPVIEKDDRIGFNTYNALVCKPCKKVFSRRK